jgi:N-carbamoyl-L-amino-acid hydrolase
METQAEIGRTDEGGLDREGLTEANGEVRDWFHDQMLDAGLDVRIDEVGNMFGRRSGSDHSAGPILLGSHLDSVPNGGIYDGPLGVFAALETVRALNDEGIDRLLD